METLEAGEDYEQPLQAHGAGARRGIRRRERTAGGFREFSDVPLKTSPLSGATAVS